MSRNMMEMSSKDEMHSYCPMMHGSYLKPQADVQSQVMYGENMHEGNCSECPMMHMHKEHMHKGHMHYEQDPCMHYMMPQQQSYMAPYMDPHMMAPNNALMHLPMMPPVMPQMMVNLDEEDDSDDEDSDDYEMFRSSEDEDSQADTNNILRDIQRNDQSIFGTLDMYGVPQNVADSIVTKVINLTLKHYK